MSEPEILYNGQCPVCSAGAAHYQRLAPGSFGECGWIDVTQMPDALTRHGLTLKAVKYRLHIVDAQGQVLAGMPAVIAIWDRMPHHRWLGRVARLPVLNTLFTTGYEIAAAVLYAWNHVNGR